jgi:Dolichyl-phosphate-mannose-protein mannosyltransferase
VSSALPLAAARPPAAPAVPLGAESQQAFLRRLIWYGFLLRFAIALILHFSGFSRRFAPDEETYAQDGWVIALYWAGDILVRPWRMTLDQPLGYFYLNGLCFYLFGQTELPIKVLNAFMGAFSGRYLYLLGRELFGEAVGRRSAQLFVFFPSLVLWSTVNIRDVWVVFLILFVSWKSVQTLRGYTLSGVLQLVMGIFALTFFRDYLFFVVAVPPVAAFIIGGSRNFVRNFILAALAGFALILLVRHGAVSEKASRHMSLEAISEVRRDMAIGGSSFHEQVDISTPTRALSFLPIGVAYFLFSPFPWEITSFLKLFSLPEMILIYWFTLPAIRGIRFSVRERFRDSFQVLLLTGLLTVSYALGEGNVGTLYRHRAQVLGFYLMFAAVGVELRRQNIPPAVPVKA